MKSADIIIIGGGMVGLALAAQLRDCDCKIKIIEKQPPQVEEKTISTRVSAINLTSQTLLTDIGAWQKIPPERLSPYQQMKIWEKDSFGHIQFDNQDPTIAQLGLNQLGFIVENSQIQFALWQIVSKLPNVEILASQPAGLGISEAGVFLTLENGEMLSGKLIIGADGANSWVRQQANIPLISQDYQHTALVCNVKTAEPHHQTARQIFDKDSILAFLPLADEHHCSIVWSLPPEMAQIHLSSDETTFNKALAIAFDNQLGLCEVQSPRAIYPLVARYARDFAQLRIALVGDAAHTIHPLAGLGVNLGFADTIELTTQLKQLIEAGQDIGEYRHLRQYERRRKVEAIKILGAMEGLKQLFSGGNPLKKLVRGVGLSLTNQNAYLKKWLIQQAAGV